MILAVPILIAVALFLGWALISLTVAALPLFAGVTAGLLVLGWSGSIVAGLLASILVAVAVAGIGPIAFAQARSPIARLAIGMAFAAPAALAAHHATMGLLGQLVGSASREMLAVMAALVIGVMAWRRLGDAARRATIDG
jgi:hypothetical protein